MARTTVELMDEAFDRAVATAANEQLEEINPIIEAMSISRQLSPPMRSASCSWLTNAWTAPEMVNPATSGHQVTMSIATIDVADSDRFC